MSRFYYQTKSHENFANMNINGEFQFLRTHGESCRIMFDVGASVGGWTRTALEVAKEAEIHCFEPLDFYHKTLIRNQFPERVICNKLGLSDENTERLMHKKSTSLYLEAVKQPVIPEFDTESVKLVTLDSYCNTMGIRRIDFIKIDVEGHEFAVLKGASRLIHEERIARIQFEYSRYNIYSRVLLRDFFDFFQSLPYEIYQITPGSLLHVPVYDDRLENFNYKNFVALHNSVSQRGK